MSVEHVLPVVQSFSFGSQGIEVQIGEDGKEWFNSVDVCKCLGYKRPNDAVSAHCRTNGTVKRRTLTEGGMQQVNFINEPNVYRLVTKSKLPSAEKFEEWVFETVLPTIRRTGSYAAPNVVTQEPAPITVPRFKHDSASQAHTELTRQFTRTFIKIKGRRPDSSEFALFVSGVNRKVFGFHEKGMRNQLTPHGYIVAINTFDEITRKLRGSLNIGHSVQDSVDKINKELREIRFPELGTKPFALISGNIELILT